MAESTTTDKTDEIAHATENEPPKLGDPRLWGGTIGPAGRGFTIGSHHAERSIDPSEAESGAAAPAVGGSL